MRLLITSFILLFVSVHSVHSQKLEYRLGYVLIQVEPDFHMDPLLQEYSDRFGSEIKLNRTISGRMGIYLLQFDHAVVHQFHLLGALRSDRRIVTAQMDHLTTLRSIPDDPRFPQQWQWLNTGQTGGLLDADINADLAWDYSTGGLTALGDTIVVAIVDNGLNYNHEDITANAWINHQEIDGNGVDDDGNGYIDDIYGWNAYDDNGDVWGQGHGLQVAGMVGAVGNNGIGVAGINWNVKLMTIVGGTPESAVLASYSYALDQRILYNESNGARGAFVVATNSSWGIDFGQPADAPLWCNFYDVLGQHGILSAGATANLNIDIDIESDLPTGCPSEYLFSVTALNDSDQRTFSAYGLTQVDFGAPGEDVLTTRGNNNYGTSSGTSFASPVTAGLVALLYSAPCPNFAAFVKDHPALAALYIRDVIFSGVRPIQGMETSIRFGGSLNAGNSMSIMVAQCSSCAVPFGLSASNITDTEATLEWALIDTVDAVNIRYRLLGSAEWDTISDVSSPLQLKDLLACTEYEVELQSVCPDTTTDFQSNYIFKTDGCCELPASLEIVPTDHSILLNWTFVLAAEDYLIQWRPQGSDEWNEDVVMGLQYDLGPLDSCTYYEVRLQTSCDTAVTAFTDIHLVRTLGCGNCIDLPYCESGSDDSSEEYIDSLEIGPLVNHTGNNGGYALFEDFKPAYVEGDTYNILLRPGFGLAEPFNEQFRIWIDYDQDGVFAEGEMILDSILDENDPILVSSFTVPDTALGGSTRMRVSMAFRGFFPTNQEPCEQLDFGEVEDYCIRIVKRPKECPRVDTVFFDAITFSSAFMYWPSVGDAIAYTYRWREAGTTEYMEIATLDTTTNLSGLEKCKFYEVQVRVVCPFDTAGYDFDFILETDCDVAVSDPLDWIASFQVYPNPTSDRVQLRFTPLEGGDYHFSIYNLQGYALTSLRQFADARKESEVNLGSVRGYPPGVYLIMIERNGKRAVQKLVVM